MNQRLVTGALLLLMILMVSIAAFSFNPTGNKHYSVKTDLNIPFKLTINQTAVIPTEDLNITFLNLSEDSRCTSDVQCIWEGQAIVQIGILKDDQNLGTFNLIKRAGNDKLNVIKIDGYSISLEKVEPYPVSTKKIASTDYSIVLKVNKN